MSTAQGLDTVSAGAAWVDRFLLPILRQQTESVGVARLRCLQIQPDDEDEAERVRALGHHCTIGIWKAPEYAHKKWELTPVIIDPGRLPFANEQFHLVFTGALGRMVSDSNLRLLLPREIARVCSNRGVFLAGIGNRYCPVDLGARAGRLHGPFHPEKASFGELRDMLVAEGAFAAIRPLSIHGHFGFGKLPGPVRFLGPVIARWLRWSSNPATPVRYASPLNSVLMILGEKRHFVDAAN